MKQPRNWQVDFVPKWAKFPAQNFLLEACPGAGKTLGMCFADKISRESGRTNFLLAVGPTDNIRQGWARNGHELGLNILPVASSDFNPYMWDGIAISYAQVSTMRDKLRRICREKSVNLVLDEVHHASEKNTWGRDAEIAFENATRRTLTTGTPFRSDIGKIPYVNYVDGYAKSDFSYTYAEAIDDMVCRPITYHACEGSVSWVDGGVEREGSLSPQGNLFSDHKAKAQLLSVMTDAESPLFKEMFARSHDKLMEIRKKTPDAGGMVVCKDISTAHAIGEYIGDLTGYGPTVVSSEDDGSKRAIDRFRGSDDPWMVSVKMVSEGTDIPRLVVGAIATNIKTFMNWVQTGGRFIRRREGERRDYKAHIFFPADPVFVRYAQLIEKEMVNRGETHKVRGRSLQISGLDNLLEQFGLTGDDEGEGKSGLEILSGSLDGTIEIEGGSVQGGVDLRGAVPMHERIQQMREECTRLVAKICAQTGKAHREIHQEWIRSGGMPQASASYRDLEMKIKYLRGIDRRNSVQSLIKKTAGL
jgi:superfamily II DNA or RNA helicase